MHAHAHAGKTLTLVEAILQVLDKKPAAHLLVVAPSDSAADVVTARLHAFIPLARRAVRGSATKNDLYFCVVISSKSNVLTFQIFF